MQFTVIQIATRKIKSQFWGTTALLLTFFACQAHAQTPSFPEMTTFSNWVARYRSEIHPNAVNGQNPAVAEGVSAARQRHARLKSLMQSDPRAALAASGDVTDPTDLPPEVQQELETPFSERGDFIVRGVLAAQNGPPVEPLRRFVRIDKQTFRAHVFGNRLEGVSQYDVPVSGIILDNEAVLAESAATPQESQANPPSAWTTGGKNVLIIRVDFSDLAGAPENYSAAQVQTIADTQIAPYYVKSSYGLTSMTNTVSSSVYRLPQTAAYYATNDANDALHTDAENAAAANYTLASYDRIIVLFASLGGISGSKITYGGLANIHGSDVWCNGEFDFRVVAHELGHTYGLYHANLWQVSDGNPISPTGVDTEYGDDFDTMGSNFANNKGTDFSPWFKNILGWVADSQVKTVTSNGTYRIYAFDLNNTASAPGELVALKIAKDSTHNYWISCKTDFSNNYSMTNGVYVQWGYNSTRQSDLLDMNTPGSSDTDAGLYIGGLFNDPSAASGQGVTIHPLARGGIAPNEYRDIQIAFGTAPAFAPTFTSTPANQSGVLGQTVKFTAAASGNPLPGYQWQREPAGSSTWTTLVDDTSYSGTSTATLSVAINSFGYSGDQFRCVASNTQGSVTSTPPASLTVTPALVISTLAGQVGNLGTANGTGTNATFAYPEEMVCDAAGNLYVVQYFNGVVRKITPNGVVSNFATGFAGPDGIAIDAATNLYVTDSGRNVIKRVGPTGAVTTLAGAPNVAGWADGTNTSALFSSPWGIAVDSFTNIYVSDNDSNVIRKVSRIGSSANWAVTTIAGSPGQAGSTDGTNSQALFDSPTGLACDAAGNVYVADANNYTVRKLTPDATGTNWIVSTIAGKPGFYGHRDGAATTATFAFPYALAPDPAGNMYVADGDGFIRILSTNGTVTTLAGSAGSADGFYTNAGFESPQGIAIDSFGNIYIADTFNYTIRVAHIAQVLVPSLSITAAGTNCLVNWPVPTTTFRLLATTNLATPNWTAVTNLPRTFNNQNVVTNTASSGTLFYRLVNP